MLQLILHIRFNQAVTIYSVAIGISEDTKRFYFWIFL